ncbi:MAG: type II toxin-antitoxin system VapB family antitoxin [Solirubrobacterales bacterium]
MRTNIEIDDALMEEARELAGTKTKRETVELALRALVRNRRQLKATLEMQGAFPDFPTIEELRPGDEGRYWSS